MGYIRKHSKADGISLEYIRKLLEYKFNIIIIPLNTIGISPDATDQANPNSPSFATEASGCDYEFRDFLYEAFYLNFNNANKRHTAMGIPQSAIGISMESIRIR